MTLAELMDSFEFDTCLPDPEMRAEWHEIRRRVEELERECNAARAEVEKLKAERHSVEDIVKWQDGVWAMYCAGTCTLAHPLADDPDHGIAAFVAARRKEKG